ncbi:PH, RCC1 and FYVE domains-containing protein 1-like isoform X6 [Gossypium arboreum]|uniref:PH, RCC1 and FYVE domains-containing protein 1-like isoform X6 n=1 Tax=Gossypium arboreum TaxID=29729 RepID=UPI0022F1BE72|nr:PH, RCC1 and FYVE domains-containing protein 1-like isoform X6 [Gossypium arboreum]
MMKTKNPSLKGAPLLKRQSPRRKRATMKTKNQSPKGAPLLKQIRSKELQLACCIQHALMILICLGIAETGSLFVFGDKVVANLGFGEAKNATMPSMINTLPYSEEVACGGYHTCVVTSDRDSV